MIQKKGERMLNVLKKEITKPKTLNRSESMTGTLDSLGPDYSRHEALRQEILAAEREFTGLIGKGDRLENQLLSTRRDTSISEDELHQRVIQLDSLIERNCAEKTEKQAQIDDLKDAAQSEYGRAHSEGSMRYMADYLEALEANLQAAELLSETEQKIIELSKVATIHRYPTPSRFLDPINSYLNMFRPWTDLRKFKFKERLESFRELVADAKNRNF
jgi:uncharacterized small protein (DUF1192 family)